ncbi:MAG: Gfo/Idh/MocA family oxidoreductase [Candidatus Marinimicrobia bacterium]|nr:Gfo/Idh/MocA family oxidoreductase [Candidatus Neomarinimicrobiota bacterium]MBL7060109.1 Gfo/Idh/MocA family oxidoreductase [Candidatus Neomarinimicrobiota bacterium]
MKKQICVVGAGLWGKNHIRTLNNIGALSGVVESRKEILNEISALYPNIATFTHLEDALEVGFDGFTVATPPATHFKVAKIIIESGKHVLVEKPITLDSIEAKVLKNLATEKNVNLMVGHVLLFHPAIRKIKELIENGKIGRLQYIYSNRLNLGTVRTEENVFWSFAPHDISIFQYFTDSYPVRVQSVGSAFLQKAIHDTTMTTLHYPKNIMGHIYVSWLHPFKEHRLVVIGSKGMIRFEDSADGKPLLHYDKGIDWEAGKPVKRDGPTELIEYGSAMPLTEELQYFVDHLDGTPVTLSDGKNAVEVLEILEKASEQLTIQEEE